MVVFWAAVSWAEPPAYVPEPAAASAYAAAAAAGAATLANPKAADAASIAKGAAIYSAQCVICHGPTGHGDGLAATMIDPKPADFTDAVRWNATSIGTKQWIVMNGVAGTGMIPRGLETDHAWEVLAFMEATFQPAAITPPTITPPPGG